MPWRSTSVMQERIDFVVRASSRTESFSSVCRISGVSRPTGHRWLKRYRSSGAIESLCDRSRRPRFSPARTAEVVERKVIALRTRFGWGVRKLQLLLAEDGLRLPVITIHWILKRHGLTEQKPMGRAASTRFERSEPNELWQMDFKGDVAVKGGRCYPLTLLDDHSRYSLGVYALAHQRGDLVYRALERTFEEHGLPDELLMDHGSPWYSTSNGHGLTWLTVALLKQDIRLIYSGIRHPQTQGKIERFHRTLKHAIKHRGQPTTLSGWQDALDTFRTEYNQIRPHEALQMQPPARRYRRSRRIYNPTPPEWEYQQDSEVRRLNSQGCLDYQRQRLFVCEALAGERIQIQQLEQSLLIRYRKTYIRHINLQTRKSTPLITDKNPNKL